MANGYGSEEQDFRHLDDPRYDYFREKIALWRGNGRSRKEVLLALRDDEEGLNARLREFYEEDGQEHLSVEQWQAIVNAKWERLKEHEDAVRRAHRASQDAVMGDEIHGDFTVPINVNSSWQKYCESALDGWMPDEKKMLSNSVLGTLKRLSRTNGISENELPVQGLVVGHVQSGKTAHMAGLMAMAADHGFNFFIVLTGIIDNLRHQTQTRLFQDLRHEGCNLNWLSLERLSPNSPQGQRLQDLFFGDTANDRHMTTVLKNSTRLNDLLTWFHRDPSKWRQMRILVIDDEADQASVNTGLAQSMATTIFRQIRDLVNISTSGARPLAMNYIGYTATPYSVLLNDAATGSLYPRNFVATLPTSPSYFGPSRIFGCESTGEPGLDVVRDVEAQDVEVLKAIHDGEALNLPVTLMDALAWFLCGVAVQRFRKYRKPVTMLVHTSMLQLHHGSVSRAISQWFEQGALDGTLLIRCREIFEREKSQFRIGDLEAGFTINQYGAIDEVESLPGWHEIEGELEGVIGHDLTSIPLDPEHDGASLHESVQPHEGVHLCVDNSANGGVQDDSVVRLVYPTPLNRMPYCPAYIVVGGNTLARGLTIEGLISSFFLRTTGQADTLMQMGRWFGYRRGYELLPRIWLTPTTRSKFRFLADVEHDFRQQVKIYASGLTPGQHAVGILNPEREYGAGFQIAAKNKRTHAGPDTYDFQGVVPQTTAFIDDTDVQARNLQRTEEFLADLPSEHTIRAAHPDAPISVVVEGVGFDSIASYLERMRFASQRVLFGDIEPFIQWYREATSRGQLGFADWNVVIGSVLGVAEGDGESQPDAWNVLGHLVPMVRRSRLKTVEDRVDADRGVFSIGVLRDPKHIAIDGAGIDDLGEFAEEADGLPEIPDTADEITRKRVLAEVENTPQLLIYRIRGDSEPTNWVPGQEVRKGRRMPLWPQGEVEQDIIGVSIILPGARNRGTAVSHIAVQNLPIEDAPDIDGAEPNIEENIAT